MASITREPGASCTTPGVTTAPATWTTTRDPGTFAGAAEDAAGVEEVAAAVGVGSDVVVVGSRLRRPVEAGAGDADAAPELEPTL
jgi:hypothetical protein